MVNGMLNVESRVAHAIPAIEGGQLQVQRLVSMVVCANSALAERALCRAQICSYISVPCAAHSFVTAQARLVRLSYVAARACLAPRTDL